MDPERVAPVNSRLEKLLPAGLALAPLALVVSNLFAYGLDLPVNDAWELVPLLEKQANGTLSFADVWAHHSEHRIVFPRLIMLALAWATRWDVRAELATTVVLGALTVLALGGLAARTLPRLERRHWPWTLPVLSVAILNMRAAENWLWGWQIQLVLCVLAQVVTVLVLSREGPPTRAQISVAAVSALVATYSFGNGFLAWPAGLLLLAARAPEHRSSRALVIFGLVGVVCVSATVLGDPVPPGYAPIGASLSRPVEVARYIVLFLGGPVATTVAMAYAGGVIGPIVLVLGLGLLARERPRAWPALAAPAALGLIATATAVLTALARAGWLGAAQALSSRYVTLAALLWVAVALVVHALAESPVRRIAFAARAAALLLVALLAHGTMVERENGLRLRAYLAPALRAVAAGQGEAIRRIHRQPEVVLERARVLARLKLWIYRG